MTSAEERPPEEVESEEDNYEDGDFESGEGEEDVPAPAPPAPAPAEPVRTAMPALPPRGLGGMGLGGLPSRPAVAAAAAPRAASPPAATAPSSSSGMPSLPARPGGMPSLPARMQAPTPAGMQAPTAPTPPTPSLPARPAGPSLPARPAGAGPSLPARPTAAATAGAAAPSTGPSLPARPAAAAAGAAASSAGPSLPARPAAGAASSGPTLPARPAAPPAAAPAAPVPAAPAPAAAAPAAPAPAAAAPAAPAAAALARPAGLGSGFLSRPPGSASALSVAPAPPPPVAEVVDPTEDRRAQKIQRSVQDMRVRLIRAAGRLGLRHDSEQVNQFLAVIERVERMAGASIYKGTRRVDLGRAAEREARELDAVQPADGNLGIKVKVLVMGMTGTGKSEFINAMLERDACRTNAFSDSTKRIRVIKGSYHGIQMEFIDTPGLHASNTRQLQNKKLLRSIKSAYERHKPNYVFYVDRLDATRPSLGELTLLGLMNESLGPKVWRETMIVLTHAHACRTAMGAGYDMYSRQRRNIVMQLIRQASGDQQVRNPMHLVDSHPDCPTNSFGQPVVMDGEQAVAWKQAVYMQLVGYRVYEEVQAQFRDKTKTKAVAAAAAGKQADMFRQMMRPRLPPVSFFVEMMAEGVMKPETWGAIDDPMDAETDDEGAEEFEHMYYKLMYRLAREGNPWAQKEYDNMLRRMGRLRKTYKDAFENEDLEMMAGSGFEGYVAEGLDLGTTFGPEDGTNHRYCYCVGESDWSIMPTLDYYGYEHEDAITGFVADYEAQFFNHDGWGGLPFDLHLAVEKDKATTCLQGESHVSLVHCVPPFGPRHITQLTGSFELLRPNLKDVLYQLEVNTFRDGLLAKNDHAGCGLLFARLGEGGAMRKGPTALGLRLQDTMRLGAFKVDACATKVRADGQGGAKDEAWGGRAHVHYDLVPGLGMLFDFYQAKTKDGEGQIGGWASNWTYDWEMLGAACGLEVDCVHGTNAVHVDLNIFSATDYRLVWLLVLPAWNWVRGTWAKIRAGPGDAGGEEVMEEVVEEEEEEDM
ncbi:hypothetical protein FOA52_011262 [Chlamydomonas sp. UWO 241]|nr:hypothetical protein FOA52_011262 [Chlamydomonas sp. UWO 241]